MKKVPRGTLTPITALISWEDNFRGEYNWGSVAMLMADGTVWERPARRTREGVVEYRKARKRQTLKVLKKDWGKDLEGMARVWRFMMTNRRPGALMVGVLNLPKLSFKA